MTLDLRAVFARVKAALMRRGRSEPDAEDLIQEAWVRLARYEQQQPVRQPAAFLMRSALNLSVDVHRQGQARGEHVVLDEETLLDAAPSAESALLARERLFRLNACLARLTDKTRAVFLAHRVDGLSYEEIARQHGISVHAVHKHVAKALQRITEGMEGW